MKKKLEEFFDRSLFQKGKLDKAQLQELISSIETEYQSWFLSTIIQEIEDIMAIDPRRPVKDILEIAAENIVRNLAADAATIRLFDPESLRMFSFGAFGVADYDRLATIDLDSISGQVVREKRAIAVPSILKNQLYRNKSIVQERGFHSLLAVPLIMPMPETGGNDLLGSLQIYYREEDRDFDKLEIIHAELLARRISFVLAKKKILDLRQLNIRKEAITNKIFIKLSRREGIKLKDLFVQLIPEVEELRQVRCCSFYTVSDDQKFITLETAYPQEDCYHDLAHSFTVSHHPYFQAAIRQTAEYGDYEFERLTPSYVLIKDPARSTLISKRLHDFTVEHQIHSILLVPLRVDNQVRHLLGFYATAQKQVFSDPEIELLTFFGKEIMKATRLEFLGDVLHDLKNPAIAVAGFANRAKLLLQEKDLTAVRGKLTSYLDIIASEAARMQDLAQATGTEGREIILDLADIAAKRYRIIEEVVRESKRRHIEVCKPVLTDGLSVSCPRFGLERVVDNLLANAVQAVPGQGGIIALRCYRQAEMACLAVENTGEISPDRLAQMRQGSVRGRGLNIINRFAHANHGNIKIEVSNGRTCFILMLPLAEVPG